MGHEGPSVTSLVILLLTIILYNSRLSAPNSPWGSIRLSSTERHNRESLQDTVSTKETIDHRPSTSLAGLGKQMETWLPFVQKLSEQTILESPELLAQLFTLDLRNSQVSSIQASLSRESESSIAAKIDQANLLDGDWPGFISLAKAYIVWCAFIDPRSQSDCFERYAQIYLALQQAYANFRGSCLNLVVCQTTLEITRIFAPRGKLYMEWIGSGLLRLFNAVRNERDTPTPNAPSKKENAIFYANMVARVYFQSGQFVSAGNIFNSMHSVGVAMSRRPASEQVEYRFWLGRYLLYRSDVEAAFVHLNWAFDHCLSGSRQEAFILDWLVVPSILVGRLPVEATLGQVLSPDALRAAHGLVYALKNGTYPRDYVEAVLENPWVAARHLRPLIENRVPLLVYRRGLRHLLKVAKTDKLSLKLARAAFGLAEGQDPDMLRTEGICEALISRGLLKGNILPVSQMLVVKPQGSIPPLLEINQVLTRSLSERDQWLLS